MRREIVFGTAGHVDHGKSALVRALTGTDPDRLAEEKAREMTIDLGFAFLSLPGLAHPVAIVDVPGHEMFLRNMVAGATGIDAAIFVVAADEGVMPQTHEHLQVLQQLQVRAGLIALTKCDRAAAERQARTIEEVRALVAGTFLEAAPMLPVSALTGEGLPTLCAHLARLAQETEARSSEGPFRLPVDRAFTMKGAGTVVTGTVISGRLQVGEHVAWLPRGDLLRVRGLQVHNESVAEVRAGQRAALNLAGVEKEELARGEVLATPGSFAPSRMLDVRLDLAAEAPRPLRPRTRVRLHHGTAEVLARVVLLGTEALAPGDSGPAQLRLESALVAAAGDRFVLRSYSPMRVLGGGVILDAHPPKRRRAAGAEELAEQEGPTPEGLLLRLLARAGAVGLPESELLAHSGLRAEDLRIVLPRLAEEGRAVAGRRGRWFSREPIAEAAAEVLAALAAYHEAHPLREWASLRALSQQGAADLPRQEGARLARESLAAQGEVVISGERLRLATHAPRWGAREAAVRDRLLAELQRRGPAAPSAEELRAACAGAEAEFREVLAALLEAGAVIPLPPDLLFSPDVLGQCREQVAGFLRSHGQMSVADARTLLGVSRKYLLPLLEQLDREGVTVRQGDYRALVKK